VLTISLHQDNNYPPDSGLVGDIGDGHGIGANLNIPLPAGGGRQPYELAFIDVVIPALERFQPELILVASGLDANRYDINARMDLTAEDYRVFTQLLMDAADRLCGGRLVIIHEGGYSDMYTPYCGLRVVETLSGLDAGVPDGTLGGESSTKLWDHERAAVAAAAANVPKVPTP
jgi:acetoin utilization deacetylase AcuC-like enzyme